MDCSIRFMSLLFFVRCLFGEEVHELIHRTERQTSRLKCSYTSVLHGVIPQTRFTKEHLEHLGVVNNIEECVQMCCGSHNCDFAYMLANHCYKIRCQKRYNCRLISLRGRRKIASRLVKLVRKSLNDDSQTFRMSSHDDELLCTHSPFTTNVTLRGGRNAGNFTNLGDVESMHMCTALCCAKPTCDLAFMIQNTCIAVECLSEEMCQTLRARPNKLNPKISYIRRREINQNIRKANIAFGQPSSPSFMQAQRPKPKLQKITVTKNPHTCSVTMAAFNVTLRHGLDGESTKLLGEVHTMKKCIDLCCKHIGGNTALLLAGKCYVIMCSRFKRCETIPLALKGITSQLAYLKKPKSQLNYNGGINSGNFTMVEGVNDIFNCTMACCNKRSCELAVTFNGICYIGTCLDKCKPVKLPNRAAGFTSHLGLKIGHKDKTVSERQTVSSANTHKIVSYRLPAPTILKTSACSAEKIFHNVTLIGGMKAANITSLGKASNMQECIGMSCDYGQGDLVLMLQKNCYTVKCVNERVCKTIPAQPSKFFSRVAYLKWGSTINETDVTLDQSDNKMYPKCSRSHILHNHTLKGGLRAGNFSVISQVDSIENCAAICCNEDNCNLALMLNEVCYIGDCANSDLCVPVPVLGGPRTTSQIAFISNPRKSSDNDLINDYSLIYIFVGSFAMIISIVGIMWAIFLCMRTSSPLSKGKDRLSTIDKDSELLRDLNIYSSWNDQENELHNLGLFTNNGPLFLSQSESEEDLSSLEEYKKNRAEFDNLSSTDERVSCDNFNNKNHIDLMNAFNKKAEKTMQNL